MFFFLSKVLFYFVMPLAWVFACFGFAFFTKNPKRSKKFMAAGLVLLFVFSNKVLVNEAFLLWEIPGTPFAEIREPYPVGVLLTGITDGKKNPKDRMYAGKGVDRLIHTLQLYKLGKIRHILITGASPQALGSGDASETSETEQLRQFLVMSGVPDSSIVLELTARNTRENALRSAEILKKQFPGQPYLLITSAFHMRRAAGCFQKAGIPATPFSTDFHAQQRSYSFADCCIPNEAAFQQWHVLFHEILGFVVYKTLGYC